MRLAANGLYIEEYVKCANCGSLIYESELPSTVAVEGKGLFCSQWCVDWAKKREERKEQGS